MERLTNEIIEDFKKNFVPSNNIGTAYLILLALQKEDYDFLDKLDDSNRDKRMILLYRDLVYKGYLVENEDNTDASNVHFSLTDKSKKLISIYDEKEKKVEDVWPEKVDIVIPKEYNDRPATPDEAFKPEKKKDDSSEWIKEWLLLFPVKKEDGTVLRSGSGVTTNKMNIFLRQNPHFSKETIFEATKLYIQEHNQKANGYKYMLVAGNFISKSENGGRGSVRDSRLEAYCDMVERGEGLKDSKYSQWEDNNPIL